MTLTQKKYDIIRDLILDKSIPKDIDKTVRDIVVYKKSVVNDYMPMAFTKAENLLSVPTENLEITICDVFEYLLAAIHDLKSERKSISDSKEKLYIEYEKVVKYNEHLKKEYIGLENYKKKNETFKISEEDEKQMKELLDKIKTKEDLLQRATKFDILDL